MAAEVPSLNMPDAHAESPVADTLVPHSEAPSNGTMDIEMKESDSQVNGHVPDPVNVDVQTAAPSALTLTPQVQPQAPAAAASSPAATTSGARASPAPSQTNFGAPPANPNPHGSPTRIYLNQNITPHLLEGMKYLAVHEPEKPLKWLSDFLAEKSKEIEGA